MLNEFFRNVQAKSREAVSQSPVRPPADLFHYTSGSGLHGILKSDSLLGGNFGFMNDRSEFIYSRQLLEDAVQDSIRATAETRARAILSGVLDPKFFRRYDVYFASFCEDPDLLSQWRGYGSEDSRYCIRFRSSQFRAIDGHVSPLLPVLYDEKAQRTLLRKLVDAHLAAYSTLPIDDSGDNERLATYCISGCALPFLVRFKNPLFKEEKEWRFARFDREKPDESVEFFDIRGVMKPYRVLLRRSRGGPKLPILQVIVGASRADDQAIKSARMMLQRFGYNGIDVELSHIPLRP